MTSYGRKSEGEKSGREATEDLPPLPWEGAYADDKIHRTAPGDPDGPLSNYSTSDRSPSRKELESQDLVLQDEERGGLVYLDGETVDVDRVAGRLEKLLGVRVGVEESGEGWLLQATGEGVECSLEVDPRRRVVRLWGGRITEEDAIVLGFNATSETLKEAIDVRMREEETRESNEWEGARSEATLKAYDRDWRHFRSWCAESFRESLPASTETVARYVESKGPDVRPSTMKRRLTAINVVHNRAGEARPALRSEYPLSEVWRRYVRTVGGGVEKVAAATPEILRVLLEGSRKAAGDEDASIHLRDRVLILVGFAGALRVSEMVGLQQRDVRFRHGGMELTLRGAKTDHDREGQTIFIHRAEAGACPVGAMKAWLDRLRNEVGHLDRDDYIVRGVDRWGNVAAKGMARDSVRKRVKRLSSEVEDELLQMGYDADSFSSHSFRAGFVTWMGQEGIDEGKGMQHTRHTSLEVFRGYRRDGERRSREMNPTRKIEI